MSDGASAGQALPAYVRALLDPGAYPQPPERVELRQTHISYVFLAGDTVYKTKKPVDFGFIDQVAPERREQFCHAEVRLNRRLAPEVYAGVVPVVRTAAGYRVDPPGGAAAGEVVEWAVQMRRLPEERTLQQLLASGAPLPGLAAALVERLVRFHETAAVVTGGPEVGGAPAVRAWWEREAGEAAGCIGQTWDPADARRVAAYVAAVLERDGALLDDRLARGRVVEGHGDLRAAHVYVAPFAAAATGGAPVAPIAPDDLLVVDCIEFSDWFQFRYLDVGYDVAFLAMDLEGLGHPDLGDEVVGRYIAATRDETLGALQPLHRLFRAFVRGKVESLGAAAPEVDAPTRAALDTGARRAFRQAAGYVERAAAPAVVAMCGLPATGKSTVAGTLAGQIGAAYLSSDAVRKELAGVDPRAARAAAAGADLYSPAMHARTYAELRRRAAAHLAAGRAVVIDAMHGRVEERAAARALADEAGVPFLIAELRLEAEDARRRLAAREADPFRTSDATWEVYEARRRDFEPVTPAEGRHVVLAAAAAPAALARSVAAALAGEAPPAGDPPRAPRPGSGA